LSVAAEMLPFIMPSCDYPCTKEEGFTRTIIIMIGSGLKDGGENEDRKNDQEEYMKRDSVNLRCTPHRSPVRIRKKEYIILGRKRRVNPSFSG